MRPLEEYLSLIGSKTREEFAKEHPEPLLLFEHPAPQGRPPWTFRTARISQAVRAAAQSGPAREMLHRYAVESLGTPGRWGDRISVGRASNNDIALADASVSKLHAYFTCDPEGVSVRDMGSRNGTRVRGEPVASGTTCRLQMGDTVAFGTVSVTLLDALALYDFLQRIMAGSSSE